jgi:hypothetical protein
MILGNGRAIFHEKRAKRSRQGDSNLRPRKHRATGDSRGAGPIPGSRGKPRFTRVGRGSRSAGQPELQGLRIGEPDATGNRGGHGTERPARAPGNRGQGQPNRGGADSGQPRSTSSRQRATSSNGRPELQAVRRICGGTGQPASPTRAETNFWKRRATGTSTEHRATGVPRGLRATADFNRRRKGSLRGSMAERARGAGAQALRPRATATPGS